jgi:hypothetical protein
MKRLASIAMVFMLAATCGFAESFTGRLVDALCKAGARDKDSPSPNCAANRTTHLFAIELADTRVLDLDAAGNEKADDAIRNAQKTDLRATVTGALRGQTVKVVTIKVQ